MSNYIETLQDKVKVLEAELKALHEGLSEFKGYLCSSKFDRDTTVQVRDVMNRIGWIEQHAHGKAHEQEFNNMLEQNARVAARIKERQDKRERELERMYA
jgi:hypothetical protein